MKCNKTLSLNVEVVRAFEEEVEMGQRGRVIEALMIEFLIKHSRDKKSPELIPTTTKRILK